MDRADATGADKDALAIDGRVLQIRVLAGPVYGIIVAAEELASAAHLRAFVAHCTLFHRVYSNAFFVFLQIGGSYRMAII